MFKDYYAILEIEYPSNGLEIKEAWKRQTLKWHPDRNVEDTTSQMIDVIEAYNILSNSSLKGKYDKEYLLFKQNQTRKNGKQKTEEQVNRNQPQYNSRTWNYTYDYDVQDESLKRDFNDARTRAEQSVQEFLKSLQETTKTAAKGVLDAVVPYIIVLIIMSILGMLYYSLS